LGFKGRRGLDEGEGGEKQLLLPLGGLAPGLLADPGLCSCGDRSTLISNLKLPIAWSRFIKT
jgi:hypothetical protein